MQNELKLDCERDRRDIKFLPQFILSFEEGKKLFFLISFLSSRLNVFIITKPLDRKHTDGEREEKKRGKRRKSIFISLHNNLMIYFFIEVLAFRQCTLAVIVNR